MPARGYSLITCGILLLLSGGLYADDSPRAREAAKSVADKSVADKSVAAKSVAGKSVADIAESASKSLVVVLHTGRDGKQNGLGTGFVVGKDGLIATNLHVIGEGRPIAVQFPDGKRHEVVAVHASDRKLDLAVVRIAARGLIPLELADSGALRPGQPIVVLGHPRGLKYSVVSGVLSGKQDLEGLSMLQLAIPIEQGNSGGPVLDMNGRVHGIVTMKSLVTPNLGFAVPVNALKPLLAKPNPVPMSRWLSIGRLDPAEWKTVMGGGWRQRAGRIFAEGTGTGFGGRTLCLRQQSVPKLPFEVAVTVKLDNEAGAAGLVFGSDGGDKHYGFYPSGGRLRLTHFNGPNVYSWKIIKEFPSTHYRPGQWNTLKVRIENDRILCYVNDHLDVEHEVSRLSGAVGLAKFRDTQPEFKGFVVAARVPSNKPSAEVIARVNKTIDRVSTKPGSAKAADSLVPDGAVGIALLRERAQQLEQQAAQLRKLAQAVHHRRTLAELAAAVQPADKEIDLLRAALLIAKLDNEELDVDLYRKEVDRLTRDVAGNFAKDASGIDKLKALSKLLFQERGFHGSRFEYYTRPNSYLNAVIDDREGLPITLSVLYMEIGRRLKLNIVGVPLPGHFIVRYEPAQGPIQLLDVYDGGTFLTEKDADRIVRKFTGAPLRKEQLRAAKKKDIVIRILNNLKGVAFKEEDREGMLRYLDALVTVAPDSAPDRWVRAVYRYQTGQHEGARADCDWLLDHNPAGVPLERVRELRELLSR